VHKTASVTTESRLQQTLVVPFWYYLSVITLFVLTHSAVSSRPSVPPHTSALDATSGWHCAI